MLNDTPLGEPWEQAVAMALAAVVTLMEHEPPPGKPLHEWQAQQIRELAKQVIGEFPLDSPYAVEVQAHMLNILLGYLVFRNRLHPP